MWANAVTGLRRLCSIVNPNHKVHTNSPCASQTLVPLMARMPRLVVPGFPHHVTQRGTRRMKTFFSQADYLAYLELVMEFREVAGVEIWAYCLMPNHIHMVVVPESKEGLAELFRHVHRTYTRSINIRENWTGHLWQERFHSFVMDEPHLLSAVRYIELNPVRAGLCNVPQEWPWSSVHAHLAKIDDGVVVVQPMLQRVANWSSYLLDDVNDGDLLRMRNHGSSGRPAGSEQFIDQLQVLTGRSLTKTRKGQFT